jgi:hypothetical protein
MVYRVYTPLCARIFLIFNKVYDFPENMYADSTNYYFSNMKLVITGSFDHELDSCLLHNIL